MMHMNFDEPLSQIIQVFIDPEKDDSAHSTALNSVVIKVARKVTITEVVEELGPFLTNVDAKVRTRATLLLAEVLTRLPDLKCPADATQSLLEFYVDRLEDYHSISPCCQALNALLKNHGPFITSGHIDKLMEGIFTKVHVPSLSQALRMQCYQVLLTLLNCRTDLEAAEFAKGFASCLEGEKDPRNLLLCLQMVKKTIDILKLRDPVVLRPLYNVISCYFPITFTPPPNDPYGISSEQLIEALRQAFASTYVFAPWLLDLLMEKLATSVVNAKLDSIRTLEYCLSTYRREQPMDVSIDQWKRLQAALYKEIVHMQDNQVMLSALEAISKLVSRFATDNETAWNAFVIELASNAASDLNTNAPDSLVANAAAKVLGAIGRDSTRGFDLVLDQALPLVQRQYERTEAGSLQREAVLVHLKQFIDAIDREVDHSESHHPIKEHVDFLMEALVSNCENTSDSTRAIAIEALCHLIAYPPSPIIPQPAVIDTIIMLANVVAFESSKQVRDVAFDGLKLLASTKNYTKLVSDLALPKFFEYIQNVPENRPRSSQDIFDTALSAITDLCVQPDIFLVAVHRLLAFAIDFTPNARAFKSEYPDRTSATLRAVGSIIESNSSNVKCMEHCVYGSQDQKVADDSVFMLLLGVAVDVSMTDALCHDERLLDACEYIFRVLMQHSDPVAQRLMLTELLQVFFEQTFAASQAPIVLFCALVNSLRSEVSIPRVDKVIPALLTAAMSNNQTRVKHSVSQCLASILNKMPPGPTLNDQIEFIVSTRLNPQVSNPAADIDARKDALQTLIWVIKGLVLRSHPKGKELIQYLANLTCSDVSIALTAADGFETILSDCSSALNRNCHAKISLLFRQRLYTEIKTHLMDHLKKENVDKKPILAALSHIINKTSMVITKNDIAENLEIIVQALQLQISAALQTFKDMLGESVQVVVPYLNTVVPILLDYSITATTASDRLIALECLFLLANLDYHHIHPFKSVVLLQLARAIDDRKRPVRRQAVKVRNRWSIL